LFRFVCQQSRLVVCRFVRISSASPLGIYYFHHGTVCYMSKHQAFRVSCTLYLFISIVIPPLLYFFLGLRSPIVIAHAHGALHMLVGPGRDSRAGNSRMLVYDLPCLRSSALEHHPVGVHDRLLETCLKGALRLHFCDFYLRLVDRLDGWVNWCEH
jgi:hypothetical protein